MSSALAKVVSACPKPCAACPWRLSNQGQQHPHDFYSASNLKRLWKGLRDGARMSCHPTDPRMAEFDGYEKTAERDVTHECAGALVLVQREFMAFQQMGEANPTGQTLKRYRRERPNGLSRDGLVAVLERAAFGGSFLNPVAMARPDLSDPEIGYAAIAASRRAR